MFLYTTIKTKMYMNISREHSQNITVTVEGSRVNLRITDPFTASKNRFFYPQP